MFEENNTYKLQKKIWYLDKHNYLLVEISKHSYLLVEISKLISSLLIFTNSYYWGSFKMAEE